MKKYYLAIFLFLSVSLLVALVPLSSFDLFVSRLIQNIDSQYFDQLMWFVTSIGNQPFMLYIVGLTSLILFLVGKRKEAVFCSLSSAGSVLTGSLLKFLISRPRPEADLVRISIWLSDKSYPSNHVLVFTVFFGFLIYLLLHQRKHNFSIYLVSLPLVLLVLSIGISRIYLGAHWATDVFGGYLFGIIWLMLTIKLYNSNHGQR